MASVSSRDVLKELHGDGWRKIRQKGSHVQLKHPKKPGLITVPHPNKDLPKGTAANIYRTAGLIPPWERER
jgi:predicted RNA binding protein YcfA (HicA-like mRNA interferase family)